MSDFDKCLASAQRSLAMREHSKFQIKKNMVITNNLFIFFIVVYVLIFSSGLVGKLPQDYEVIESPRPQIDDSASTNQIFFGDLHVHTTFSQDAFLFSLPVIQGEGAHPPADACNFARFCSSLDFFSITDHAEGLTKEMWEDTIKSIKNCDAVSNDDQKDLKIGKNTSFSNLFPVLKKA